MGMTISNKPQAPLEPWDIESLPDSQGENDGEMPEEILKSTQTVLSQSVAFAVLTSICLKHQSLEHLNKQSSPDAEPNADTKLSNQESLLSYKETLSNVQKTHYFGSEKTDTRSLHKPSDSAPSTKSMQPAEGGAHTETHSQSVAAVPREQTERQKVFLPDQKQTLAKEFVLAKNGGEKTADLRRPQAENRSESTQSAKKESAKTERDASSTIQAHKQTIAQMGRSEKMEQSWDVQDLRKEREKEREGGGGQGREQEQGGGQQRNQQQKKKLFKAELSTDRGLQPSEERIHEIARYPITHFSILMVIFEILKLQIESREQELFSRREERAMQIYHKEQEAASFKAEGKWLMSSSIGSGLLAIFSGACPIIGHMKGEWIVQKLGGVFQSLRDMKPERFFKSITKMTYAMSEMYKSTGQIYSTFSQGTRTMDQLKSDLNRDWASERNQNMQEIEDRRKENERFCHEILQMLHETARQIHNR